MNLIFAINIKSDESNPQADIYSFRQAMHPTLGYLACIFAAEIRLSVLQVKKRLPEQEIQEFRE